MSRHWQDRDTAVPRFPQDNRVKGEVLIVDDTPEIRQYLRRLLELDRYQVETASSGEEAVRHIANGCTAALVLLDMQMPGMDGLETLRCLRELRPELKVIMCSGVDDPDQIDRAILLGAQAYLVKPVRHLYLSAAIERCLAGTAAVTDRPPTPHVITLPSAGLCRPN